MLILANVIIEVTDYQNEQVPEWEAFQLQFICLLYLSNQDAISSLNLALCGQYATSTRDC